MAQSVLIVGGGLAGLAAATALAGRGFSVTLLETRDRLGGRASSFCDTATGLLLDNCQHVSLGCCTNFSHFCRTVGIERFLEVQPNLYFLTPDRRVTRFGADFLPAPLHLFRSFLGLHYLTWKQKIQIGLALHQLARTSADDDPPLWQWLQSHGQTPEMIRRFWSVVLTSALNEAPERMGLRYAHKVFVDAFLRNRRGFEVHLPRVPLGRLYGQELQGWLQRHGARVQFRCAARKVVVNACSVNAIELRDGDRVTADNYVLAVPFDRLLDLLPEEIVSKHSQFENLKRLTTSPITSIHLWYREPIMELPHVVLIDCVGQWVFNRGSSAPGEHYLQVVVSASAQFRGLGHDEVQRRIVDEMAGLFPAASPANLLRARVVTEHGATFSAVPGVDAWRSPQTTPIENLFLAGDWTLTGWPATMEGAVRSGYRAAEAILRRAGPNESLVQPDL